MPLREGSSDEVIQDNIRCILEKDGCGYSPPYKDKARKEYTPAQAAAIAYAKAGRRKNSPEVLKGEKQTQSKQKPSKEDKEEKTTESAEKSSDPCWKGYQQMGMKDKGGKKVPNCVKMEESEYSEIIVPDGWSVEGRADGGISS
jgi:hypothetical protein